VTFAIAAWAFRDIARLCAPLPGFVGVIRKSRRRQGDLVEGNCLRSLARRDCPRIMGTQDRIKKSGGTMAAADDAS
jgi:hypothetical protein